MSDKNPIAPALVEGYILEDADLTQKIKAAASESSPEMSADSLIAKMRQWLTGAPDANT